MTIINLCGDGEIKFHEGYNPVMSEPLSFRGVPLVYDEQDRDVSRVYYLNKEVAMRLRAFRVVKNWRGRKFVVKPAARFVNLEAGSLSDG